MKIIVSITNGEKTYSEDVTDEEKEYFEECSTNGSNPWLKDFKQYTRALDEHDLTTKWLKQFNTRDNNAHFIFGWCECFMQSDDVPCWMYDPDCKLRISVRNEE